MPAVSLLRAGSGVAVTNIEVFFDLVYAFAVTQLSHYLLDHATVEGALQTALLLAMVWVIWASTTYLANWLDPNRPAVRLLLVTIMLVGLLMSAGLPDAFGTGGLAVGLRGDTDRSQPVCRGRLPRRGARTELPASPDLGHRQ